MMFTLDLPKSLISNQSTQSLMVKYLALFSSSLDGSIGVIEEVGGVEVIPSIGGIYSIELIPFPSFFSLCFDQQV